MKFQLDHRMRQVILIAVMSLTSLFLLIAIIKLVVWELRREPKERGESSAQSSPTPISDASLSTPSPTIANPSVIPSSSTAPTPDAVVSPSLTPTIALSPAIVSAVSLNLIIPVAGIRPDQLRDTFTEARVEGRVHNAIDIMAARNTAVLAAADGKVVKLFYSDRGGVTIYQLSNDQKRVLYYAHLDHYAADLSEGRVVKQGETIGYVGDTGNAGAGNYHLHFAMWLINDPKRFWTGENINPYPILRQLR